MEHLDREVTVGRGDQPSVASGIGGFFRDEPAAPMRVRVRYLFGLRDRERESERTIDVPSGTTVFEVLQHLGLSTLELHPAINGRSVPDTATLRDGDELILIPGIQGG